MVAAGKIDLVVAAENTHIWLATDKTFGFGDLEKKCQQWLSDNLAVSGRPLVGSAPDCQIASGQRPAGNPLVTCGCLDGLLPATTHPAVSAGHPAGDLYRHCEESSRWTSGFLPFCVWRTLHGWDLLLLIISEPINVLTILSILY